MTFIRLKTFNVEGGKNKRSVERSALLIPLEYVYLLTTFGGCSPSKITQSTFTCSKLTIGTLEQGVKYVYR